MALGVPARSKVDLPRRIWFLWFQGIDAAPQVVRRCLESWSVSNPDWEVVTLDADNLWEWIDVAGLGRMLELPPASSSDAVRVELLARHGGVWADATTWCNRALDSWLPQHMASGFFAFRNPARGRVLASWFLSADIGHPLIMALRDEIHAYWRDHEFRVGLVSRAVRRTIEPVLSRPETTALWFAPLLQDRLRLTPYFSLHYKFAQIVGNDVQAADAWRRTSHVSADGPHALLRYGLDRTIDDATCAEIDNPTAPLYKLTWKQPAARMPQGSALEYLLRRNGTGGGPR